MKLAGLEQEVAAFRAHSAERSGARKSNGCAMPQVSDVEKIGVAAKAEIEAAERAARVELKELAAKLAVDRAESLVAQQMTPGVQEALIDQFRAEPAGEAELKSASLQYANALADIALEQGAAEPVLETTGGFGAAYAESAELRTFLASPAVDARSEARRDRKTGGPDRARARSSGTSCL